MVSDNNRTEIRIRMYLNAWASARQVAKYYFDKADKIKERALHKYNVEFIATKTRATLVKR